PHYNTLSLHDALPIYLKIQAREADLVIATHGRSLYVLDDTRALRELTPAITAKDAHLFTIRPTHGKYLLPGWEDAAGKGWFQGKDRKSTRLNSSHLGI